MDDSISYINSLAEWKDCKVMVLGDVMLDKYIIGNTRRISPEAPVPVLNIEKEYYSLGGAANVAENINTLGGRASLIGLIGADFEGDFLKDLLSQRGIIWYGLVTERPTTLKTRICTDQQQLLRIDREDTSDLSPDIEKALLARIERALSEIQPEVIVISDYLKGAINKKIIQYTLQKKESNIPVLVDPKGNDIDKYKGVTLIKPNLREAEALLGNKHFKSLSDIEQGARELCQRTEARYAFITLGKNGLVVGSDDESFHVPAVYREVFDITGAGDAVIAVLALALHVCKELHWLGTFAVHAGSLAVGKRGTSPITVNELRLSLWDVRASRSKIVNKLELQMVLEELRKAGKRIVFTNGCFDIFHCGHVDLLKKAKSLGDVLIVGVNSDASIKRIKGDGRPIMLLGERLAVLEAVQWVDYLIVFDEDTPEDLIRIVRPHVLVKGSDYLAHEVVGGDFVKSYGGSVVLVPLLNGISTTKIVSRITTRYA